MAVAVAAGSMVMVAETYLEVLASLVAVMEALVLELTAGAV